MLDEILTNGQAAHTQSTKKVLSMVKNDRMGGSVPKWENTTSPKTKIEDALTSAISEPASNTPGTAHAYSHTSQEISQRDTDFSFGDLVDIVNPLHHIPIVGHVYRGISGDEIKPIGNIVGGAVFGGPVGAAAGIVNAIIQEETGKDVTGNALAMVIDREIPSLKSHATKSFESKPERQLEDAIITAQEYEDMASTLLAFSDLGLKDNIEIMRTNRSEKSLNNDRIRHSFGNLNT